MIFFVFICNRLTWLLHLNLLLWDLWVIQEVIRWRDRRNWSKEWWICPTFRYTYTMEACGNGHIQFKGGLKMLSPVHHPICRWQFGGSVSGIKISLHSSSSFFVSGLLLMCPSTPSNLAEIPKQDKKIPAPICIQEQYKLSSRPLIILHSHQLQWAWLMVKGWE